MSFSIHLRKLTTKIHTVINQYPAPVMAAVWIAAAMVVRLVAIALIHQAGTPPSVPNILLQGAIKWDGNNYLAIVQQGYPAPPSSLYAFYPIFPLLIHFLGAVTRLGPGIAGLLVVSTSLLFAAQGLFKLTLLVANNNRRVALLCVAAWLSFPTAHFLAAYYTESLFCALAVWSLYFALKNKYSWAVLLAGLASGVRFPGVIIGCAIIVHYFSQRSFDWKKIDRQALWLPVSFAGIVIYWTWIWMTTGDNPIWFMQDTYARFWSYNKLNLNIFSTFYDQVRSILAAWRSSPWPDDWISSMFTQSQFLVGWLLIVGATVFAWRKRLPLLLVAYAGGMALLLILTGNFISNSRYVLPVFPLFILLAQWLGTTKEPQRIMYFVVSSMALGLMLTLFANGFWVG